jgi:hypothetical protein
MRVPDEAVVDQPGRVIARKPRGFGSRRGLVAGATVVLLLGSVLGWRCSRDWRIGRVAQSDVRIDRGVLEENRLLGQDPIPYAPASNALVISDRKADLVEWTGKTVIRRDGVTGKPIWDAARGGQPVDPSRDPVASISRLSRQSDGGAFCRLIQPAPDLNGDGFGDVVWAIDGQNVLLAMSGKDGSLLWTCSTGLDQVVGRGPENPSPPAQGQGAALARKGRFLGEPTLADIDRDGTADVIATVAFLQESTQTAQSRIGPSGLNLTYVRAPRGQRGVVAVSGRSGRILWNYAINTSFPKLLSEPAYDTATVLPGPEAPIVAVLLGSRWVGLDLATGQPRIGPIDLQSRPVRPVQYADLDGDGAAEVIFLVESANSRFQTMAAFVCKSGKPSWTQTVSATYPSRGSPRRPAWPLVADLDGDHRAEIVVSDFGSLPPGTGYKGVRMLDGNTGKTRWVCPLSPFTLADDGLEHLLAGPDLDGDGTSDLIAVSRFDGRHPLSRSFGRPPEEPRICVDAISAKDGRRIWWWQGDLGQPEQNWSTTLISPPFWWGRGPDGWPLLATSTGGIPRTASAVQLGLQNSPVTHLLVASTGYESQTLTGLSSPKAADLDGDGIDDLWGSVAHELRAIRGAPAEALRAPGPARGEPANHESLKNDPRWERPLPWASGGNRNSHPLAYLALAGLALVDVVVPLTVLWLATRKRFWSVRMLMALPAVIAIPLGVNLTLIRQLPEGLADSLGSFAVPVCMLAALAGLPPLAYVAVVGAGVIKRRWHRLAVIVGLTALTAGVLGAYWILSDIRAKPAIEHYSSSDWHFLAWPAAYAVGAIVLFVWALRGARRLASRRWRRVVAPAA